MKPEQIRALIHEHRAAGRVDTVLAMEAMLPIVERLAREKETREYHCTVCELIVRSREALK